MFEILACMDCEDRKNFDQDCEPYCTHSRGIVEEERPQKTFHQRMFSEHRCAGRERFMRCVHVHQHEKLKSRGGGGETVVNSSQEVLCEAVTQNQAGCLDSSQSLLWAALVQT